MMLSIFSGAYFELLIFKYSIDNRVNPEFGQMKQMTGAMKESHSLIGYEILLNLLEIPTIEGWSYVLFWVNQYKEQFLKKMFVS